MPWATDVLGDISRGEGGKYLLSFHVETRAFTSGTIRDKKPGPDSQYVHFMPLSLSISYFRENKLESNKYSFCCELGIFNTSFLIYNCTWLNSLKNLFLLIWRIYYLKWEYFKGNSFESFLYIYFNTACSISYDGEICMTKTIFRGLNSALHFMYTYYISVCVCIYKLNITKKIFLKQVLRKRL